MRNSFWNSLIAVLILTVAFLVFMSCSGTGDSSGNPHTPDEDLGLHILSAVYDEGVDWDIDDNTMTIYFSKAIDLSTLPPSYEVADAFVITGTGQIWARTQNYTEDGSIYKLEMIMGSIAIAPEIGTTQIALAEGVIEDANGTVTGSNTASTFIAPYILLKTGQTESYDVDGNVVLNDSIHDHDDGYYELGREFSYSRDDASGIVTDNTMGLMWQDNTALAYKQWLTDAAYSVGDWNNTSGDTAATYCGTLELGSYDDWQLPTVKELTSLIDYNKTFDLIDPVFQYKYIGSHWSSNRWVHMRTDAWTVNYNTAATTYKLKDSLNHVRCVRER